MRQSLLFQRIAKLVVAILLAVIAGAVYRSFVFSQFVPIRVAVIGAELHSSQHAIKIALPDLSTLRGQTAVLRVRLRNARSEERHVGLLREGLPQNRVVLPPDRTIGWDVVLSPETVGALGVGVDDAARSLDLTGDADGWALTALDIQNYYVRLGDRVMAVVLPEHADSYAPGTRSLSVGIALFLVALVKAFGPKSQRRSLRLIGNGLTSTAVLVCMACLVLPRISPYKVMLSPSAFWLVATGLFSPVLLQAVARLGALTGPITRGFAVATQYSTRHAVTFERGAAVLALGAVGIAQPIFDVVSNSPEFFAARSTPPATAVAAVLVMCLGIPFVLLAVERGIRIVSQRAAATFHGMALALLSAAVVMPWFRRGDVLTSPWDVLTSALVGLAVALAYARTRIVRQFFTALAPAALVVPAVFLLDPDVAQTFLPSESAAAVQAIEHTPPIVLVVFDELPLNSLLDADRRIDAERYPNFAALAREAYWFRNASTVSSETVWAVPAILSGRYPTTSHAVPTLRYYPVNLFTALARHYDIFASLRFQKLCPPRACQYNAAIPPDTVRSLVSDFGLVWLHIVLPQALTEELPPVVGDWAEFGDRPRAAPTNDIPNGRGGVFAQFLSSIDGQPARLHVIHSMLPHMAFEYVPSGRRYRGPDYQTTVEKGKRLFERASPAYADTLHQRHLAQVGYVDRLLGDLIVRLREVGAYDKALVIITADHGASYQEGEARRAPQQHNLSDIIRVPLIIKLPDQRSGEVVDRIVETVDILPTILDVVSAKVSLRLDGRSLIDDRVPERSAPTFIFRDASNVSQRALGDSSADRAASLDRKLHRFGSGDLKGLYAPSGVRHLLGMKVNPSGMRPAPDVQISIHDQTQFAAVNRDRDPLPLYVRGVLSTSRKEPVSVAVIVNGVVAAVSQSYRERNAHVFGTLIPETSLRDGNNTVTAFVVDP